MNELTDAPPVRDRAGTRIAASSAHTPVVTELTSVGAAKTAEESSPAGHTGAVSTERAEPNLIFVELVHQALRVDSARLKLTVAALAPDDRGSRLSGVREFYGNYREQLVSHHTNEDRLFFPALAARVGKDTMHLDELVAQHHQLDGSLQDVGEGLAALADPTGDFSADRTSVTAALSSMAEQLTTHLDLEERTALPLVISQLPVAEYDQLESKARKATPARPGGVPRPVARRARLAGPAECMVSRHAAFADRLPAQPPPLPPPRRSVGPCRVRAISFAPHSPRRSARGRAE